MIDHPPVPGALMAAELAEQPAVLGRLSDRHAADRDRVRAALPRRHAGTVLLARGSSDNVAVYGRYLIEMASGRPAGLAAPSLHTRYQADVDYRGYLAVALSQSGATPEVVQTAAAMRRAGAMVVGITNEAGSPLTEACQLTAGRHRPGAGLRGRARDRAQDQGNRAGARRGAVLGRPAARPDRRPRLPAPGAGGLRRCPVRGRRGGAGRPAVVRGGSVRGLRRRLERGASAAHGDQRGHGADPRHRQGQQLALASSLLRGLNPDAPAGLSKVTATH